MGGSNQEIKKLRLHAERTMSGRGWFRRRRREILEQKMWFPIGELSREHFSTQNEEGRDAVSVFLQAHGVFSAAY